jgi:hypothetical protein
LLLLRGLCTILRSEAGGQDLSEIDERAYKNNSHWLEEGENSNHVAYYDAAALYPSSGKNMT